MHPFRNRVALAVALLAACTQVPSLEQVADEFVRAYFVQSDMRVAAKLASGGAKANLTAALQQIDAAGAKEPAKLSSVTRSVAVMGLASGTPGSI